MDTVPSDPPHTVTGVELIRPIAIGALASSMWMITTALHGSFSLRRTLITRSKVGAGPAGIPVICDPLTNVVQVTPSRDHSRTFPVSPGTSMVTPPVALPAHIGLTIADAIGVPTVPD